MDVFGGNWVNYLEKIFEDWSNKVKDDDLVLIGGDISWAMNVEDAVEDLNLLAKLKGKKIMIKGNHDYWWSGINKVRDILPEDFYALQNDCVKFKDVIICGSRLWSVPGSTDFKEQDRKIYLREAERLKLSLKAAKRLQENGEKIISLVHFPPFNIKKEDTIYTSLFEEYGVSAVIYGHLHGKVVKAEKEVIKNNVTYYLTSCDLVANTLTEIVL